MQVETEFDGESKVRIRETPRAQHFDAARILRGVVDVKIDEVEEGFQQRMTVLVLYLGQRIAPVRKHAQLVLKHFPDQLGPRAARQLLPERQRVQEQSGDAFTVNSFRTAVRNDSGQYVFVAAEQSHDSEVCGQQDTLERDAR